jgi:hypothetical protein
MHKVKDTPKELQEAFKKVCEIWETFESQEAKSPEEIKEHFFLAGYIEVFRMLEGEKTP